MLYRLVRPMKRSGSSIPQFVQRIPADVRARAVGRRLAVPLGNGTVPVTISSQADSIRFSLRTRDPAEVKIRQATAAAYLETIWQALRQPEPVTSTHKQATALAGELYRAWADEERQQTLAVIWTPQGFVPDHVTPEEDKAHFESTLSNFADSRHGSQCARRYIETQCSATFAHDS